MNSFTLSNIPNLDICVLAALELFDAVTIPEIKVTYERPLIVGSGNAAATGKIIFADKDAIFADESTYEDKLKNIETIDGVVLLSASGGKHAPVIARAAKKKQKNVMLITNNKHAEATKYADQTYVFPKNREPYTYNTSTYMGMILGKTKEDPKQIIKFITENIDKVKMPDFSKYKRFFLIIPEELSGVKRLLQVKFIELFGRNVARDVETFEYMKHAVTVVPAENELFVSFGQKYTDFGKHHLTIPLPKNTDYVTMMAIGYYLVGKIQQQQPDWFKKNIADYTKKVSNIFGKEIKPIVD